QHLAVVVRRRMLDFILKFLQAVLGKSEKQADALVGRFRVADLVCFEGAQVVLLRRRRGADGQDSPEQTRGPEQGCRFAFHGCFSSGGAAGLTGAGRRGKSSRIISSSMVIKSWRTSRSEEHTSELQSRGHLVCR